MKKLIFAITGILLISTCLPDAQAQNKGSFFGQKYFKSAHNGKDAPTIANPNLPGTALNSDTLTNSGTRDAVLNVFPVKSVSVTLYVTKGTGTRTAKATLEASDDNVNWSRVRSIYGTAAPIDSMNIADASGTVVGIMLVKDFKHKYLRVHMAGSATQSTFFRALATYKAE